MKKIIALFVFMLAIVTPFSGNMFLYAKEITKVRVVSDQTAIYKDHSITSEIIDNCKYNTVFEVIANQSLDYKLFYKVKINVLYKGTTITEGYILKAHTIDNDISSPTKKLDSNAKIKNDNSCVYLSDNEESLTEIKLSKNTEIRILDGYDKSKVFTRVQFTQNDNIVTYYIKTADILVKGVNISLVIAIMTIITCVCALSIVLGIKAKHKRKRKQK